MKYKYKEIPILVLLMVFCIFILYDEYEFHLFYFAF